MRKRMLTMLLALALFVGCSAETFAVETKISTAEIITNVEDFKDTLNDLIADGSLTTSEKQYLEDNSEADVITAFIDEKMDAAVSVLNNESEKSLGTGQEYCKGIYDLGDGCTLTIELLDESATDESGANARATSGSNTVWKNYGERYFTASATVSFSLGFVTMRLKNYYILSSKGIDEDRGVGSAVYSTISGTYSVSDAVITDATARTVGASDVNMECKYTLRYSNEDNTNLKRVYKITSTVGFVDINKTEEKVKVKQSWNLTRVS